MDHSAIFRQKTVLITGGTGTFGRAFARRLLEEDEAAKVIIFSRDEWKQWEMKSSNPIYSSAKIRYFLGDVRDSERLLRALHEVNFVVHAAALKQVPAAEYNPSEFIKTNVLGANNLIGASIDAGVEKVVALSTDKAVNPINLYGATKLCAEKLFIAAKSYVGKRLFPQFCCVRYGNVMGSRGSLLPYWQKMIDEGAKELPITDQAMTRFWITIDEAVTFVKNAFFRMQGAEIFVPKSPSCKITDLASCFANKLSQQVVGIRPGEKIHELLITQDDAHHTFELSDGFAIAPGAEKYPEGKKVAPSFSLTSNSNPLFTENKKEIEKILSHYHADSPHRN